MREVLAVGSLKGAPGVTTLALALASSWPTATVGRRPVVVEADVAGGDLAARFGLSDAAGLMALAAGGRGPLADDELDGFVQEVPGGVKVIAAPTGEDQAAACAAEVAARPALLRGDVKAGGTVLLDLGHVGGDVSRQLVRSADRLLLVCQGGVEALAHVMARGSWLDGVWLDLLVVGECRYAPVDIAKSLGVDADRVHMVPWDARTGAALAGRSPIGGRRWRRSPLTSCVRDLAVELAGIEAGRGRLGGDLARLSARTVPEMSAMAAPATRVLERGELR
ncbi:hypothetical protein ACFW6F_11185 [Streptomyces sp. NPDC058746]|uniref:hypothetical protein n=1 Tax=Streptomyces sp. NPDC058746 TaxID=3346622 RepID=UPI00369EABCA